MARRRRRLRALAGHLRPPRRPSSRPAPAADTSTAQADADGDSWVPTSGLFFEDYDILPRLTNDMVVAKSDLDRFGYCLWRDAIDAGHVGRLCRRIVQQAEAEQREGLVKDPEAAAHFMSCVINKGEEFCEPSPPLPSSLYSAGSCWSAELQWGMPPGCRCAQGRC
eukprot:COSAG04_NODE_86_length_27446_cov_79.885046_29_plen_166_part_00